MIGSAEAVEVTVCPTAAPIFLVPKSKQRRVSGEEVRMLGLFDDVSTVANIRGDLRHIETKGGCGHIGFFGEFSGKNNVFIRRTGNP